MKFPSETDLASIQKLAKSFLYLEPEKTEYAPIIIHHPFTSSGFVSLRDSDGNIRIGNIVENEADKALWHKQVEQIIAGSQDAYGIYSQIEKNYALAFLKYAAPSLSQKDFSIILGDAWLRSEQPNHDPNLSQKKLLKMFSTADPGILMEEVERKRLAELDAVVTIYRGIYSDKRNSEQALSWTLSRDTARWFANHYGRDGNVYEAKIEKKHIQALFLRRDESEVIVDPEYLMELHPVQQMEERLDMEQTM